MTALECVNVCFIASYMHSTGPEDLPLDTRLCCRFWAMSSASTLGVQVHALSFDRGFVQHDVVDDETKTERIIQARDQVEKFRVVYAPFVQSGDVRSASGDCCNDSSPCQSRFFPMETEETGASASISGERYAAAAAAAAAAVGAAVVGRFNDGNKPTRICISNGISDFT